MARARSLLTAPQVDLPRPAVPVLPAGAPGRLDRAAGAEDGAGPGGAALAGAAARAASRRPAATRGRARRRHAWWSLEPAERRGHDFQLGDELTVGRAVGCGGRPARRHLRLPAPRPACSAATATLYVEDLGSTNGTYLNERQVTARGAPAQRATGSQFGKTILEITPVTRAAVGLGHRRRPGASHQSGPAPRGRPRCSRWPTAWVATPPARWPPTPRWRPCEPLQPARQPPPGLVAAAQAANRAVWDQAGSDPELRGMGTTLVALALVNEDGEDRLAIVNIGDSRALPAAPGRARAADHRPQPGPGAGRRRSFANMACGSKIESIHSTRQSPFGKTSPNLDTICKEGN